MFYFLILCALDVLPSAMAEEVLKPLKARQALTSKKRHTGAGRAALLKVGTYTTGMLLQGSPGEYRNPPENGYQAGVRPGLMLQAEPAISYASPA